MFSETVCFLLLTELTRMRRYKGEIKNTLHQLSVLINLTCLERRELYLNFVFSESVTFDPDTAGSCLVVTEDGRRLKYDKNASPYSPGLSDLFKRFDGPKIFGTEGFTSGRHYWEVKVGVKNNWDVGVAKESASRSEGAHMKKENGFFAIQKRGADYSAPHKDLHLCPRPRLLGVYLDYNEGRVSFYDVNRKMHIFSFTGENFTEPMFPYFYLFGWMKKPEALVIEWSLEALKQFVGK